MLPVEEITQTPEDIIIKLWNHFSENKFNVEIKIHKG